MNSGSVPSILRSAIWRVVILIQAWSPFVVFGLFILWIVIVTARLSVHTQKHLASFNEKDWLVDTFVWINRHTSHRPR